MMNDVGTLSAQVGLELSTYYVTWRTSNATQDGKERWNECSHMDDIHEHLSEFGQWRGSSLAPDAGKALDEKAAVFILLTDCHRVAPGEEGVVGLAYQDQVCNIESSTVCDKDSRDRGICNGQYVPGCTREDLEDGRKCLSGVTVVSRSSSTWLSIAHELGHMLGALHNCNLENGNAENCDPKTGTGIMSYKAQSPQSFEQQEGERMCQIIEKKRRIHPWCFYATTPTCGNGIRENDEECDDESECCDSATCKLAPGKTCSKGPCCDKCFFKSGATPCDAHDDGQNAPWNLYGQFQSMLSKRLQQLSVQEKRWIKVLCWRLRKKKQVRLYMQSRFQF